MSYTVNKAVEAIEAKDYDLALKLLTSRDQIFIEWRLEDVYDRADAKSMIIDSNQAQDILYQLDENHDANYGVNWDTIDFYLDEIKEIEK